MSTIDVSSVAMWIDENMLDKTAWTEAERPEIAVTQSIRNLNRWYPGVALTDEIVAYQSIWELQGLDPVLKYQKQGVKTLRENRDEINYGERDKVSPEVKELLGAPQDKSDYIPLSGGELL